MKCSPEGRRSSSMGVSRDIRSKPRKSIRMPRRPAIAARWMIPLVEPPMASSTRIAFSNAAGVMICAGVTPDSARRTACAPVLLRSEAAGPHRRTGMAAPPGSIMPSDSAMHAIELAVPITMQVPAVGASSDETASISAWSISSAR